jgi:GNAT superfamily N-acetyltransferase
VATVPAARRRGIGIATVGAALNLAREKGYRVAVLFSSEMGVKMYQKLGFQRYYDWACYTRRAGGKGGTDNKD